MNYPIIPHTCLPNGFFVCPISGQVFPHDHRRESSAKAFRDQQAHTCDLMTSLNSRMVGEELTHFPNFNRTTDSYRAQWANQNHVLDS